MLVDAQEGSPSAIINVHRASFQQGPSATFEERTVFAVPAENSILEVQEEGKHWLYSFYFGC